MGLCGRRAAAALNACSFLAFCEGMRLQGRAVVLDNCALARLHNDNDTLRGEAWPCCLFPFGPVRHSMPCRGTVLHTLRTPRPRRYGLLAGLAALHGARRSAPPAGSLLLNCHLPLPGRVHVRRACSHVPVPAPVPPSAGGQPHGQRGQPLLCQRGLPQLWGLQQPRPPGAARRRRATRPACRPAVIASAALMPAKPGGIAAL